MRSYRIATTLIAPLLPLWLHWRKAHGKEDALRIRERFGYASRERPKGTLLWLHVASVGEANSVLSLIHKIRARFPGLQLLLTTGTVTSAQLMQSRLPQEVIHQYVPVDTPDAVRRFIRHWKPDLAFWVESEFWPNLIMEANEAEAFMGVINGRISERSFRGWNKRPHMIKPLLGAFDIITAQTPDDAKRFEMLGAKDVVCFGNLKYDAELLPCDEDALIDLQNTIGTRPVWLASSTHPGEEDMIAQAHTQLVQQHPTLLTIIVPRHPARGMDIAEKLKPFAVQLRTQDKLPKPATQVYIADTLGELGLFYRLCDLVFMGGSLVAHGGQNPLEPARLGCAVLSGPYTHNFADIYRDMEQAGGCIRVENTAALVAQASTLLEDATARDRMQNTVRKWMQGKGGTADRLLDLIEPALQPRGPKP